MSIEEVASFGSACVFEGGGDVMTKTKAPRHFGSSSVMARYFDARRWVRLQSWDQFTDSLL